MSITLNATAMAEGDVVIDVDAATGAGNTAMTNAMVIGAPALALALGVDEGRLSGWATSVNGQLLSLRVSVSYAPVSASNISDGSPAVVNSNISYASTGGIGLSDGNIVGRLRISLGPWMSQVAVQRVAGSCNPTHYLSPCSLPVDIHTTSGSRCARMISHVLVHLLSVLRPASVSNLSGARALLCLYMPAECGNGVCELGEACSSATSCANSTSLCPRDCPVSTAGAQCPTSGSTSLVRASVALSARNRGFLAACIVFPRAVRTLYSCCSGQATEHCVLSSLKPDTDRH